MARAIFRAVRVKHFSVIKYIDYSKMILAIENIGKKLIYINMINKIYIVGIATRYCLDGLGIESQWGRDFPHPPRTGSKFHPAY